LFSALVAGAIVDSRGLLVIFVIGPQGPKATKFMPELALEADIARKRKADGNDPDQARHASLVRRTISLRLTIESANVLIRLFVSHSPKDLLKTEGARDPTTSVCGTRI
jgi:hypothetical protein